MPQKLRRCSRRLFSVWFGGIEVLQDGLFCFHWSFTWLSVITHTCVYVCARKRRRQRREILNNNLFCGMSVHWTSSLRSLQTFHPSVADWSPQLCTDSIWPLIGNPLFSFPKFIFYDPSRQLAGGRVLSIQITCQWSDYCKHGLPMTVCGWAKKSSDPEYELLLKASIEFTQAELSLPCGTRLANKISVSALVVKEILTLKTEVTCMQLRGSFINCLFRPRFQAKSSTSWK